MTAHDTYELESLHNALDRLWKVLGELAPDEVGKDIAEVFAGRLRSPTEARGEPVAWRWQLRGGIGAWCYSEEKPSFCPRDEANYVINLVPLYASHPPAREAVDDATVERFMNAMFGPPATRTVIHSYTSANWGDTETKVRAALAALPTGEAMSETKEVAGLVERLRVMSQMIQLGERIAWGSDSALMDEAAREIERLTAERDATNWLGERDA